MRIENKFFESALKAAVAAFDPALRVAYHGVRFEPVEGSAYVESILLPARAENPTLGDGFHRQPGIFQATVVAPSIGRGTHKAFEIAEAIANAFPRGRAHFEANKRIVIDFTPTISAAVPEGAWVRVPVSVSYTTDVQPVASA